MLCSDVLHSDYVSVSVVTVLLTCKYKLTKSTYNVKELFKGKGRYLSDCQ